MRFSKQISYAFYIPLACYMLYQSWMKYFILFSAVFPRCSYFGLPVIITRFIGSTSWSHKFLILSNKIYTLQNDIVIHYTLCSLFSHAKTISFPQLTHLGENQKNWTRTHISVSKTKIWEKDSIMTNYLHPRKGTTLPQCTIAYNKRIIYICSEEGSQ